MIDVYQKELLGKIDVFMVGFVVNYLKENEDIQP